VISLQRLRNRVHRAYDVRPPHAQLTPARPGDRFIWVWIDDYARKAVDVDKMTRRELDKLLPGVRVYEQERRTNRRAMRAQHQRWLEEQAAS